MKSALHTDFWTGFEKRAALGPSIVKGLGTLGTKLTGTGQAVVKKVKAPFNWYKQQKNLPFAGMAQKVTAATMIGGTGLYLGHRHATGNTPSEFGSQGGGQLSPWAMPQPPPMQGMY